MSDHPKENDLISAGARTEAAEGIAESDQGTPTVGEVSTVLVYRYGAYPNEWDNLVQQGLTANLLPVVSSPKPVKSPRSNVSDFGKVPSKFNRSGQAVGFPAWTTHTTTDKEIATYRDDDRLGICISTHHVRGIDVDVNHALEAAEIEALIDSHLGFKLPARRRANSSKFLMCCFVAGDYPKRVFTTKTVTNGKPNIVEILCDGQQFIAHGTHVSGVRYEWDNGVPAIPTLTPEQFDSLLTAIGKQYAEGKTGNKGANKSPTTKRRNEDINDPRYDFLVANWPNYGTTNGRLNIVCPWEGGHTPGSSESSTSYIPAGVGGILVGRHKCQHASCEGRTEGDFDIATGYAIHGFEVIPVDDQPPVVLPPPNFAMIKSGANTGKVKNTLANVTAALSRPDVCGYQLRFDNFRHGAMLSTPAVDEWRPFSDVDYTELRLRLARPGHGHNGFEEIGKETIRDAVEYAASMSTFDSAILWIESLNWDGIPRVERTLEKYFGTTDTPYHRAISRYLWTALAGRVTVPGIKADMVPVAVGKQGTRKSSTVAAIVPASDFFIEANLAKDDDDLARLMRGKLVVELAELNGLRKKEVQHVKDFITKQHEEWTPKFKEFNTRYARRCVFFGTTNENEFLSDKTGHRRWLPFDAGECDPEAMARDRDQLWAEALVLFRRNGIMWADAETLATDVHEQYVERDAWEEAVIRYLLGDGMGEPAPVDSPFTAVMVLRNALSIPPSQINKGHKDRMATVLASISDKLGLVKCKPYIDGMQQRGYRRSVG